MKNPNEEIADEWTEVELMQRFVNGSRTASCVDRLRPRQSEILRLLVDGHSMTAIAKFLAISRGTACEHKFNMMKKLGLNSNAALLYFAFRQGIVPRASRVGAADSSSVPV